MPAEDVLIADKTKYGIDRVSGGHANLGFERLSEWSSARGGPSRIATDGGGDMQMGE